VVAKSSATKATTSKGRTTKATHPVAVIKKLRAQGLGFHGIAARPN
jgi:hypothetical protein